MMELGTAISAISASAKVLKGAIEARDDALIRTAQIELQERLGDALTTTFSQMQAMHTLELEAQSLRRQLAEADARQQQLVRELEERTAYRRAQPTPGKWAYVPSDQPDGPPETTAYFCAACHAEGKHVVLQYEPPGPGRSAHLLCKLERSHSLSLGGALPKTPAPPRRSSSPFVREW